MQSIGTIGRAAGVKVPTIRYYEQIGLLPEPQRSPAGQRVYGTATLRRLSFIRHARELGFPLEAIRDLLRLSDDPDQPCAAADAIARRRQIEVRARIARLQALDQELDRMIEACAQGDISGCRVIETLSDHGLCAHSDHGTPEGAELGQD